MADDKRGRDKQAHDADRRQRKWELEQERRRGDEQSPGWQLGDLDGDLESLDYPATTADVVDAFGDRRVEIQRGWSTVEETFEPVDGDERYDSADDVRSRLLRLLNRE